VCFCLKKEDTFPHLEQKVKPPKVRRLMKRNKGRKEERKKEKGTEPIFFPTQKVKP
jgi:hypothetical protein